MWRGHIFESSIPEELYEAAAIDGCSNLGTFFKIALPLAKPILAVMVIFTMVAYWNDWFTALIYMSDKDKYPLQLALRQILIQSQATATMMGNMDGGYAEANKVTELIKFASIVVGALPMLIAYPFVQKYFEKRLHGRRCKRLMAWVTMKYKFYKGGSYEKKNKKSGRNGAECGNGVVCDGLRKRKFRGN